MIFLYTVNIVEWNADYLEFVNHSNFNYVCTYLNNMSNNVYILEYVSLPQMPFVLLNELPFITMKILLKEKE